MRDIKNKKDREKDKGKEEDKKDNKGNTGKKEDKQNYRAAAAGQTCVCVGAHI